MLLIYFVTTINFELNLNLINLIKNITREKRYDFLSTKHLKDEQQGLTIRKLRFLLKKSNEYAYKKKQELCSYANIGYIEFNFNYFYAILINSIYNYIEILSKASTTQQKIF